MREALQNYYATVQRELQTERSSAGETQPPLAIASAGSGMWQDYRGKAICCKKCLAGC